MDRVETALIALYDAYFETPSPQDKGTFYSRHCRQICRPHPSFAARDPATIVGYLEASRRAHASPSKPPSGAAEGEGKDDEDDPHPDKGSYTIRPLRPEEVGEFGSDEVCLPAGLGAEEMAEVARREGWRGMRVDLSLGDGTGRVVEVKYWWKWEGGVGDEGGKGERGEEGKEGRGGGGGGEWKQCLHDILYIGPPRNGGDGGVGK